MLTGITSAPINSWQRARARLGPLCAQASAGGDRRTMATLRPRSAGTLGDVAYRGDSSTAVVQEIWCKNIRGCSCKGGASPSATNFRSAAKSRDEATSRPHRERGRLKVQKFAVSYG